MNDDHYRLLRDSFEVAMRDAKYAEIRDLYGNLYDWQHENGYKIDDRSSFDFWKLSGLTPVPW